MPLSPRLIKPYPGKSLDESQRMFNYRLSRATRTIENAFGILAAKWRIFRRPIKAKVDLVQRITQATVCLHIYLRITENASYISTGFFDSENKCSNIVPGDWRNITSEDEGALTHLGRIGGNRYRFEAGNAWSDFEDYFNSNEGAISWQLNYVRNCGYVYK